MAFEQVLKDPSAEYVDRKALNGWVGHPRAFLESAECGWRRYEAKQKEAQAMMKKAEKAKEKVPRDPDTWVVVFSVPRHRRGSTRTLNIVRPCTSTWKTEHAGTARREELHFCS